MAGIRKPGPTGLTTHPCRQGHVHYRGRTPSCRPGPGGERGLTPEEQGLLLDVVQMTLDIIGIIEPTPLADGTSAVISAYRRDWFGAAISAVSLVPYLGDFAKIGKLSHYARSIREAIAIARQDARFARLLDPTFRKLAMLIDEIPLKSLPERIGATLGGTRAEIASFLHIAGATEGTIARVMNRLPAGLRSSFERAMNIPRERNPRLLRKHPGPVAEDVLIRELKEKGFVRVKQGSHPKAASPVGKGEDSDIWLRRVQVEGKESFEAIRVDRIAPGAPAAPPPPPGNVGGKAAPFRQEHHTLSQTTHEAGTVGANLTNDTKDMVKHLDHGRRKGDFSHWHHEMFEATPENLATYLEGPLKGTRKFDPVGIELARPGVNKQGKLTPAAAAQLKAKLAGSGK